MEPASEADAASTENAPVESAESELLRTEKAPGPLPLWQKPRYPHRRRQLPHLHRPSGPWKRRLLACLKLRSNLPNRLPAAYFPAIPDAVRIVIRATADSYVAVRTADNETLFSRLLRPGDSHAVPSGADLLLETGNAGGLQITVGGKRVPSLGPVVRFGVIFLSTLNSC